MRKLVTALGLAALIAAPTNSLRAQTSGYKISAARAQAIKECMAVQKRNPNEAWPSMLPHYRACMAAHGQPE
ncbi:MAG: hypothetical protein IT537_23790 [Hyphomicrobiales bacterium]|nr:hypothetical protein [Hyphomicrobiales bacterium]